MTFSNSTLGVSMATALTTYDDEPEKVQFKLTHY